MTNTSHLHACRHQRDNEILIQSPSHLHYGVRKEAVFLGLTQRIVSLHFDGQISETEAEEKNLTL